MQSSLILQLLGALSHRGEKPGLLHKLFALKQLHMANVEESCRFANWMRSTCLLAIWSLRQKLEFCVRFPNFFQSFVVGGSTAFAVIGAIISRRSVYAMLLAL